MAVNASTVTSDNSISSHDKPSESVLFLKQKFYACLTNGIFFLYQNTFLNLGKY